MYNVDNNKVLRYKVSLAVCVFNYVWWKCADKNRQNCWTNCLFELQKMNSRSDSSVDLNMPVLIMTVTQLPIGGEVAVERQEQEVSIMASQWTGSDVMWQQWTQLCRYEMKQLFVSWWSRCDPWRMRTHLLSRSTPLATRHRPLHNPSPAAHAPPLQIRASQVQFNVWNKLSVKVDTAHTSGRGVKSPVRHQVDLGLNNELIP